MSSGFGSALTGRAKAMARLAARRMADAMAAAAQAELPNGISAERADNAVVLSGPTIRQRYWGSARRAADAAIRNLVQRMIERGRQ